MRILDENDKEITEDDVDTSKGWLKQDKLFKLHHDEVEAKEEKKHYEVKTFYFDDGTSLDVDGNDDQHVQVIDDQTGIFSYVDQGEEKTLRGIDIKSVIDQEKTEHKDAYDEYEDIQRYVLYTEDELKENAERAEKQAKQNDFMENGPDRLESNTISIEDLTLLISDVIGGAE